MPPFQSGAASCLWRKVVERCIENREKRAGTYERKNKWKSERAFGLSIVRLAVINFCSGTKGGQASTGDGGHARDLAAGTPGAPLGWYLDPAWRFTATAGGRDQAFAGLMIVFSEVTES